MADRKDFVSFMRECSGVVQGYALREGQELPETYQELLAFMYDRLGIQSEGDVSIGGLSECIMSGGVNETSCSPGIDTQHAETVILIGDLPDPDTYVSQLPLGPRRMLPLPPSAIVRELILKSEEKE